MMKRGMGRVSSNTWSRSEPRCPTTHLITKSHGTFFCISRGNESTGVALGGCTVSPPVLNIASENSMSILITVPLFTPRFSTIVPASMFGTNSSTRRVCGGITVSAASKGGDVDGSVGAPGFAAVTPSASWRSSCKSAARWSNNAWRQTDTRTNTRTNTRTHTRRGVKEREREGGMRVSRTQDDRKVTNAEHHHNREDTYADSEMQWDK